MKNYKFLNLFLRLCLSISVDTGWTAQAQASVHCQQLFTVAADRRCSCVRGWWQILAFDIGGVCSGAPNDRA